MFFPKESFAMLQYKPSGWASKTGFGINEHLQIDPNRYRDIAAEIEDIDMEARQHVPVG